jgi:hypothetical protein
VIVNLVTSGQIAVIILILTMFEAAGLVFLYRFTKRGVAWQDFVPNLLAGDFLLVAWITNEDRASWKITGLALFLSLTCHLTDLVRRWR